MSNFYTYFLTTFSLWSKNPLTEAMNVISNFSSCILNLLASHFLSDFSVLSNLIVFSVYIISSHTIHLRWHKIHALKISSELKDLRYFCILILNEILKLAICELMFKQILHFFIKQKYFTDLFKCLIECVPTKFKEFVAYKGFLWKYSLKLKKKFFFIINKK